MIDIESRKQQSILAQRVEHAMDQMAVEDQVASHGMLPSILDSKLWKVKCKPGLERLLVVQLLRKAVDHLNNQKPFMILSAFHCEKSQGCLYVEAYNMAHVKTLIHGITGVYRKGIEMIPYKEMTQLLKIASEIHETTLSTHQWVRIKSGPYAGDLGIVELIEGGQRALVKLIPRIKYLTNEEGETKMKILLRNTDKHLSAGQTVSQRLFNPQLAKNECRREKFEPLGKSFYVWQDQMFRNGFLYHFFKISKLISSKVAPRLEEVQRF